MSDTPKTDAQVFDNGDNANEILFVVPAEFARTLELDLAEAARLFDGLLSASDARENAGILRYDPKLWDALRDSQDKVRAFLAKLKAEIESA